MTVGYIMACRDTILLCQFLICIFFINRPISIFFKPLFQSDAKCEAIDMKMSFCSHANKTHFHNKGFVLSLILKVGVFGTWKWPISTRKTTISIYYCLLRLIGDLNLIITKVYGVQATIIDGQNAFAPLLCFAQVLRDIVKIRVI